MAFPAHRALRNLLRGGRMVESSRHVKPWRDMVSAVAFQSMVRSTPSEGRSALQFTFYFQRPKSHYRTGKNSHLLRAGAPHRPTTRSVGDTDKLLRDCAIPLSVTSGGSCIVDDSSVVWIYGQKDWTDDKAGCMIRRPRARTC